MSGDGSDTLRGMQLNAAGEAAKAGLRSQVSCALHTASSRMHLQLKALNPATTEASPMRNEALALGLHRSSPLVTHGVLRCRQG